MSAKTDEILESLKTLSLLEASELVKQIEEAFGVSAAASAGVVMAAPGAAGGGGEAAEEKTEFDVILEGFDASAKIKVLKAVREATGLGWATPRLLLRLLPRPSRKVSPRKTPRLPRRPSKKQAARSPSSDRLGRGLAPLPLLSFSHRSFRGPVFLCLFPANKKAPPKAELFSRGTRSGVCPCFDPEEAFGTPHTSSK